ncbi:MAG: Maf family protein [Oscillospiraceae bacterium]|nr:Maf family protein [Oscillospiraceae bacterium]
MPRDNRVVDNRVVDNPAIEQANSTAQQSAPAVAPLLLASASPRRREILSLLGVPFEVCPAANEPPPPAGLTPAEAAVAVARAKAEQVAAVHSGRAVLGADTMVVLDNRLLGKPRDAADAKAMLRALQGREHEVVTGVWLIAAGGRAANGRAVDGRAVGGRGHGFADTARVTFLPMSEEDINVYIATGEPMDKAGAYGVQGVGGRYIARVDGDFYTVMGLPAQKLLEMREFGDIIFKCKGLPPSLETGRNAVIDPETQE